MRLIRLAVRACALTGLVSASLMVMAPASAHVTVDSPDAEAGGFGKLVFRVPTESETASTTKLTIHMPEDTPFAFVNAERVPGWDVKLSKEKHDEPVEAGGFKVTETVSEITWTADKNSAIKPGEFAEFAVSVGPLPEQGGKLEFAADQKYSDDSTVAWDESTPESGDEPEHPAPTLTIASQESAADDASQQDDGSTLAIASLAVSIVAVLAAGASTALVLRERRRAS